MKIALAGNPNSGKTTLFNELTKLNQKIGNWPGVTTERKSGKYFRDKSIDIIDLPGVYSLSPLSGDEIIAVDYINTEKPDVIINVVDSTHLERSLALTLQLIETDIPVVLALNMEDELKSNGLELDIPAIELELGCAAVLISARKNRNLKTLMDTAGSKAGTGKTASFVSVGANDEEKSEFRHKYINSIIDKIRKKSENKATKRNDKIDKIVLNKWLAFPIFAFVIWLMYFVSIQTIGALSIEGMEWLMGDFVGEGVRTWLTDISAPLWVVSLLVDGLISGVGAVLSFLPQILILFLFITFLEGCGYMSRVAIIMDRVFRRLGLSGKSFVPMIVGCGCSVPAIMSAKTIEGDAERRATVMLTPFIPCSAKLPVFALIAGALFPNNSFVAPSMYFLGILMVIIGGLILKWFRRSKAVDDIFLIELPHYRLPKAKNVALEIWDKLKDFIIRAGAIIVPAVIVLWFLQTFSFGFQMVDIEDSMLAAIGRAIAWIFYPLGFGDWRSAIAVMTGFFAKETIVATFGVLISGDLNAGLAALFTPQAAYAFMAFTLLAAPCIAAIAATKRELGGRKQMWIAVGFQCAVAYAVALIINLVGNLWAANRAVAISILTILLVAAILFVCIRYMVKSKGKGCSGSCANCKSNCKGKDGDDL